MKKLLITLMAALTFNASAGVITVDTKEDAGSLLVDFYFNEISPEVTDFDTLFNYDSSVLAWDEFNIYDGFLANDAIQDDVYVDGYVDTEGVFELNGFFFFDDWADYTGTDLYLGQAQFDILSIGNRDFTLFSGVTYDVDGNEGLITQQVKDVPEPPALAIFALGMLALFRSRKSA